MVNAVSGSRLERTPTSCRTYKKPVFMVLSPSKKPLSMHRIPIVDGDALRAALQQVHREQGTHQKAAEHLGIKKHTFTKLLNGSVDAMAFDTYASIMESVGGRAIEFGRVPDPVLGFATKPTAVEVELERQLGQKVDREAKAVAELCLYENFKRSVLTEESQWAWDHYHWWVSRGVERLEKKARPLVEQLEGHPKYGRYFRTFLEKVRGRSVLPPSEDKRCWLALYRAVEPLCDSADTGGVERTWEEMDEAGHLRSYLKVALKREELLMDRERDLIRIRRFPADLIEWMKADLAGVVDPQDLPAPLRP